MDLALNNLQRLICHKTKQTKPNVSWRNVFLTEDTATSRATSSRVGVSSLHNIYLMGRKYNYIIFEWRNCWYLRITMTRKYLHVTYGILNRCFDLIRSYQQCTLWTPPLEIEPTTTVRRSRNSTTGPLVHATYEQCRINNSMIFWSW